MCRATAPFGTLAMGIKPLFFINSVNTPMIVSKTLSFLAK